MSKRTKAEVIKAIGGDPYVPNTVVAERLGCSDQTVARYRKDYDLERIKPPNTDEKAKYIQCTAAKKERKIEKSKFAALFLILLSNRWDKSLNIN